MTTKVWERIAMLSASIGLVVLAAWLIDDPKLTMSSITTAVFGLALVVPFYFAQKKFSERTLRQAFTPMALRKDALAIVRRRLGNDAPVTSGNGTPLNPFVIGATAEYVAVEHAAAKSLLDEYGFKYRLVRQSISTTGSVKIDELVFEVQCGDAGSEIVEHTFYFDITVGYDSL